MKKYLLAAMLLLPTTLITLYIESIFLANWPIFAKLTGNNLLQMAIGNMLATICGMIALLNVIFKSRKKMLFLQFRLNRYFIKKKSQGDDKEKRIRLLKNLSGGETRF